MLQIDTQKFDSRAGVLALLELGVSACITHVADDAEAAPQDLGWPKLAQEFVLRTDDGEVELEARDDLCRRDFKLCVSGVK